MMPFQLKPYWISMDFNVDPSITYCYYSDMHLPTTLAIQPESYCGQATPCSRVVCEHHAYSSLARMPMDGCMYDL